MEKKEEKSEDNISELRKVKKGVSKELCESHPRSDWLFFTILNNFTLYRKLLSLYSHTRGNQCNKIMTL